MEIKISPKGRSLPTQQTVRLTQAERFCIGLNEIANETDLETVTYNLLGFVKAMEFGDGSEISLIDAFRACGFELQEE